MPINSQAESLQNLEDGYLALLKDAELLRNKIKLLSEFEGIKCEDQVLDLTAIAKGEVSSIIRPESLDGINSVVRAIVKDSKKGI